jgi:hypothetical protein
MYTIIDKSLSNTTNVFVTAVAMTGNVAMLAAGYYFVGTEPVVVRSDITANKAIKFGDNKIKSPSLMIIYIDDYS